MNNYMKYNIINGELNLYITHKEFAKISKDGNSTTKLNFHLIHKKSTKEEKLRIKIRQEIDELKELVNKLIN